MMEVPSLWKRGGDWADDTIDPIVAEVLEELLSRN
jgi:hypothetical protein